VGRARPHPPPSMAGHERHRRHRWRQRLRGGARAGPFQGLQGTSGVARARRPGRKAMFVILDSWALIMKV
jgi:hypothetical protein